METEKKLAGKKKKSTKIDSSLLKQSVDEDGVITIENLDLDKIIGKKLFGGGLKLDKKTLDTVKKEFK